MKGKPHPPRILSHVSFSWHLAEEISEPLLISIIYLERRNNLFHPLPMGKEIYSAEPGNLLREGKYLPHEMRNLLRHACYAQVFISQPLSSSAALRIHSFPILGKSSETLVLLTGMFFSSCLPWWVFPHPDIMVVRDGHRIALFPLCFACLTSNLLCGGHCCRLCHSLLHASPEEEECIQNRLTGNCPLTFYHFVAYFRHHLPSLKRPQHAAHAANSSSDGAHAGFECGFPQSWPPRLQILKVPLAQPVPQPSPKLFDWVQMWGPRRRPKKGDATLRNATAGGQKFGVLGLQA